jgi:chaperonin GroES
MKLLTVVSAFIALEGTLSFTSSPAFTRTAIQCNVKIDGRTIEGDFKPTNNFILVKLGETAGQSEGGLFLTAKKAKFKKAEGQIVSTGPGRTHEETGFVFPMPLAPGDGVVYGKFDGEELNIDGAKHILIQDNDVVVKYSGAELTLETANVIADNVLVYIERKKEEKAGDIFIAKSSFTDARPSSGEVVKVGPGRHAANGEMMPMEVAPGDMVKFRDFAGQDVTFDGKDYSVVRMSDILAKF